MAKEPSPPATPPGPEPANPAAHDQKGPDRAGPGSEGQATDAYSGSPDVFVSYASQDAAVAHAIVKTLERNDLRCWIAPRDVTPGGHYADAIIGAISGAKTLVLVLSDSALASKHVGKEIERASSKGRPIIALRTTATPLPPAFEYFLSESQWIDVGSGGIEAAAEKLVDAIRSHLTSGTPSVPAKPRAVDRKVAPSRRRWIAIASAAAFVTALAYFVAPKLWLAKHPPAEQATTAATPAAAISDKSIAVLPFVDMSEKHDQEYFSDGLAEELIDHLAHITDLKVVARTSSFAFKGKNEDMRTIATKLGVANLLEGSVRKSGGTLRITAQLIRASDGVHRWSETYDRKLNDIFKVQDEISTTVVRALNAALNPTPAVGVQPMSAGTTNVAAYNLVLEGNYYYERNSPGDEAKAVEYFQQALKLDPRYALPWAKLARIYAWQGAIGEITANDAMDKVRNAVARALVLDPNCALAYYSRGNAHYFVAGDWIAAQSDFEKAAALDPHGELGDYALGNLLSLQAARTGRFETYINLSNRMLLRNPLDTTTLWDLAWWQEMAGHLNDAVATSRRLLNLNPTYETARAQYGLTLLLMGRYSEALATAKAESDEASRLHALACIEWAMGQRANSDSALGALEGSFADRNPYLIAAAHAFRGEVDVTFAWLERTYQHRRGSLYPLKLDPLFRSVRGDPRFNALLRKAKLTE